MANRLPKLGNFSIPSGVINSHEWVSDAFIDTLGKSCTLIYPAKITECSNCYYDARTARSTGIYKTGGPNPFPNNSFCPVCGGAGRTTAEVTESNLGFIGTQRTGKPLPAPYRTHKVLLRS